MSALSKAAVAAALSHKRPPPDQKLLPALPEQFRLHYFIGESQKYRYAAYKLVQELL